MTEIKCRRVMFYSQGDETAFYSFAQSIPAVRKIDGITDSIILRLRPSCSDRSLRDLIALLFRYKIDMRPLAELKTEKNSVWFCDPQKFWHKKVFK